MAIAKLSSAAEGNAEKSTDFAKQVLDRVHVSRAAPAWMGVPAFLLTLGRRATP
jgi:hypothetical protein